MIPFLILTAAASLTTIYGYIGLAVYRNWPTEKLRESRKHAAEALTELQLGAR
jgi:hypothetical protein